MDRKEFSLYFDPKSHKMQDYWSGDTAPVHRAKCANPSCVLQQVSRKKEPSRSESNAIVDKCLNRVSLPRPLANLKVLNDFFPPMIRLY